MALCLRANLQLACAFILVVAVARPVAAVPNLRLTADVAASQRPRVALTSQHSAVVVWQDTRTGNAEIFWQRFTSQGEPLSALVQVTTTTAASVRPDVSVDPSGHSHIVWQEGENPNGVGTVHYCVLDSVGATIVSDITVKTFSGYARVAARTDGGCDMTYAHHDAVDADVYFRRYSSAGVLLCEDAAYPYSPPGVLKTPTIVTFPDGPTRMFWREISTSFAIHLREGDASVCNVGTATALSNTSAYEPTIAAGGGYVFKMYTLNGNIYNLAGSSYQINQNAGTAGMPSVGADSGDGYVVWRDSRDGNGEIYFCRFWLGTNRTGDVRVTDDAAESTCPDIAVDGGDSGDWVAVWEDGRDGNREIYMTSAAALAAPPSPTGVTATLECPPAAAVSWTDASLNETRFEVEQSVDGGAWMPVASTGPDATSVTVGGLAYGTSCAFRVRACDDAQCSAWTSTPTLSVPSQPGEVTGMVRATVVERPYVETPLMQPLGHIRVELRRDGVTVAETLTDEADGSFVLPGPIACDDEVVARLENPRLQVWHSTGDSRTGCLPNPDEVLSQTVAIGYAENVTIEWPASDDVQVAYLMERMAREYWGGRLLVTLAMPLCVQLGLGEGMTGGGGDAGAQVNPPPLHACIRFEDSHPQIADAVYHEFTHRVVIEAAGSLLGNGTRDGVWLHPEAAAMDEGLADYFTASFTDDHIISHLSHGQACPLRRLDQIAPAIYPTCTENLQAANYFGARVFAGALWDLRTALLDAPDPVSATDVDRAVWAAMKSLTDIDFELRTMARFRAELLKTALGLAHPDEVRAAFDRHNISDTPATSCQDMPYITYLGRRVEGVAQQITLSWTKVPSALFDRVYMSVYNLLDSGLNVGTLVADSVSGTTATISYPDTTVQLSFVVVPVDSTGEEGPWGVATPVVLDVDSKPAPIGPEAFSVCPNPARGTVVFRHVGRHEAGARLEIYDVAGRRVRVLHSFAGKEQDTAEWTWDRRNTHGTTLPAGVYLVRLVGSHGAPAHRIVLID
jgi:hypothetical protein